jgi:quinol monooxygenase YgiN
MPKLVVLATFRTKPGEEAAAREAFLAAAEESRLEPGCEAYDVHQSVDDPRDFFLYERYADRAAFEAHLETDHFHAQIEGVVRPLCESRGVGFFEQIG